jgi:putative endonuclease
MHRKKLGDIGEDIAVGLLKKFGFSIIDRNYYITQGEIDIIAHKARVIHFIEVKTTYGSYNPAENFHKTKLMRFLKAVRVYCYKHAISEKDIQIDLALVDMKRRRFNLIKDANIYFH